MQHNPADTFAGWIDLWGMTNIEVRFADNSDDRRSVDREFPSRASVKRESRACETKNMVLISHHCFFAGTSTTTMPGLPPVASTSAICQSPSVSTFRATTRPVRANQLFSIPVRSELCVKRTSSLGQLKMSEGVTA
jgi:hypothetical protein